MTLEDVIDEIKKKIKIENDYIKFAKAEPESERIIAFMHQTMVRRDTLIDIQYMLEKVGK